MNLKDLKTRTKLFIGFGASVVLTVIVAYIGINSVSHYSKLANSVLELKNAETYFINTRLSVQTYTSNRVIEDYEKALALADSATHSLNRFMVTTDNTQSIDSVAKISKELVRYLDVLHTTQSVIEQEAKLLGQMRKTFATINELDLNSNQRGLILQTQLNVVRARAYDDFSHLDDAASFLQKLKKDSYGVLAQRVSVSESELADYLSLAPDFVAKRAQMRLIGRELQHQLTQQAQLMNQTAVEGKNRAISYAIVTTLVTIVVSVLIAVFITNFITKALVRAIRFAGIISQGDLNQMFSAEELEQKDEVGDLSRSLNSLNFKLKEIIAGVHLGAQNVSMASSQSSSASQQLSEGSSEQAASVEEISSTMEQIAANIQQNTANALETKSLSEEVSSSVKSIGAMAQESLDSIKLINGKIKIINDIAMQTNILALNAAVESARAGEHGRGFAVVAAEVRKLAENSRVAADEIIHLADQSLNVTMLTTEKFVSMANHLNRTNSMVHEIAAASAEQTNGVMQVHNAIQELNRITQYNTASSEELASSAEELAGQAEQLQEMIAFFNVNQN